MCAFSHRAHPRVESDPVPLLSVIAVSTRHGRALLSPSLPAPASPRRSPVQCAQMVVLLGGCGGSARRCGLVSAPHVCCLVHAVCGARCAPLSLSLSPCLSPLGCCCVLGWRARRLLRRSKARGCHVGRVVAEKGACCDSRSAAVSSRLATPRRFFVFRLGSSLVVSSYAARRRRWWTVCGLCRRLFLFGDVSDEREKSEREHVSRVVP